MATFLNVIIVGKPAKDQTTKRSLLIRKTLLAVFPVRDENSPHSSSLKTSVIKPLLKVGAEIFLYENWDNSK